MTEGRPAPQEESPPTRAIDLSVEVPGTPEEVWEAIATGPGISSWFLGCDVEQREGGRVTLDFGSYGEQSSRVTAWEPPQRVVFEGPAGVDGSTTLAYEWLVEGRGGGTCVVRLVNSGFGAGAEWDADFDGTSQGWQLFLENLRLHLTHFRGRRARTVTPTATAPGPNAAAWEAICSALGVAPDLRAGDRLATSGEGVPPLAGTVDGAQRAEAVSAYRLLLDTPSRGTAFVTAEGRGDQIALSVWLYLYGDETEHERRWSTWLPERFPAGT